jgi:hypothetical protein
MMHDSAQASQPYELSREKRRDYRNTLLLQLTMLTSELLLEDLAKLFAWPIPDAILKLLYFALSGLYLFFLWDMLRNFTLKRWLTRGVLGVLIAAFGTLFVIDVLMGSSLSENHELRLTCHLALLGVQVVVAAFALRDLFQGSSSDIDKLWGSACLFFMSGFVFAELLFCILLKDPTAFGHRLPQEYWGLFEALYLSLTALIGLDNNAYPDCSRLVRNIALLEGAWSQLYLVLLIGRLLSKDSEQTARP